MNNHAVVPFNDLTRIHNPLIHEFEDSVKNVAETSSFVLGRAVKQFEDSYAAIEDAQFVVGVDNGTNAIELMLRAAGIKKGDEVITSAFTFVATVFAIERAGAKPVLVDIEPNSPLMDPEEIEKAVTTRTKAILLVSLHGRVSNIEKYVEIAQSHNLIILLDGAQSHLAKYAGKNLVKYFTAISTSFYPGKNLGALGEGGAVITNNADVASKVQLYRDWGAAAKYEHDEWGANFRLHSLQAKFLSAKLRFIEEWTNERRSIGKLFNKSLPEHLLRSPIEKNGDHVFHIYEIRVKDRNKAGEHLTTQGIQWGIHYPKTVYQNKAYSHLYKATCPNAEAFSSQTISIPLFPRMTEHEQNRVIDACKGIY